MSNCLKKKIDDLHSPRSLEKPWICAQRVMPQLLMVVQHFLWLYRSIQEWQSRLQWMHMKMLCFLSIEHAFPQWQAFISSLFTPDLSVNHVSSMSDCWQCLPTFWCPLLPCPFCRCPWSNDVAAIALSCQCPVPCTEGPLEFSHPAYGMHVQARRAGPVGEGDIGWVTGHRWELQH